jgi:putative PIN family toxin of toxin-antitoxin system
MIVSYDLLHELETVLLRDKFRKKLTVADVLSYVEYLHEHATVVSPSSSQDEYSTHGSPVSDPDDEYLVYLAEAAKADRIVSGDPHLEDLPQTDTPRVFLVTLVQTQLENLTAQIPAYYSAYFAELRSQLERPEVFSDAVPDWMRGYKRVVTISGRDGVVVVHFPRELEISIDKDDGTNLFYFPSEPLQHEDTYDFIAISKESASVLANVIGGGEDIQIGIEPDVVWGVRGFDRPQQRADTSGELAELSWQAPWTRMIAADLYSLSYFNDPERAKEEARSDVEPYVTP